MPSALNPIDYFSRIPKKGEWSLEGGLAQDLMHRWGEAQWIDSRARCRRSCGGSTPRTRVLRGSEPGGCCWFGLDLSLPQVCCAMVEDGLLLVSMDTSKSFEGE